ncbi:MAG: glycosyltransferase family 4 protein [Candidatus Eisenbacteria bacterium]
MLHLDTGTEWRGGQQQVLYLTQGLQELGVISVVATPQGSPLAAQLRQRNLPVIEIAYSAPYAPKVVRRVQRILSDRTWNILHMHTSHAHTLGFLSLRLPPPRAFHRPAFVVSRRVDFVPNGDPLSRLKYTSAGQFFLCVSDAIREILEEYGIPARSLYVVRSGVAVNGRRPGPDARRALRRELHVPENAFLLGAIGQLVPHKGHRYLLDAMTAVRETIPEAHLVVIGEGNLESDLRKQAAHLGLNGSITFAGYRPGAISYLPAFDLFVHASVEEGLGTSILDAEAAGIPVVATRAGGIPEAVSEGESALLVAPAETGALAHAILELGRNAERRSAMGEAGRRFVSREHSDRHMVEETLAAYQDILGKI